MSLIYPAIPLIPDLFRLVLEYSNYEDRNTWKFPEDTGPIYDHVIITAEDVHNINRMRDIALIGTVIDLTNYTQLITITIDGHYNQPLCLHTNTKLKKLRMKYNFISNHTLDLTNCPELRELSTSRIYNQTLDLSANSQLIVLRLGMNYNKPLDLQATPKLYALYINNNFSYPLRLSDIPELRILHMYDTFGMYNSYKHSLDFTKVPNLIHIYIAHYAYPLDISHNLKLEELWLEVYSHPIDLTNCINLTTFINKCNFNHELDLSNVPELSALLLGYAFNCNLDLTCVPKLTKLHIRNHLYNATITIPADSTLDLDIDIPNATIIRV